MAFGRSRRAGTVGLSDDSITDRETGKCFFCSTAGRFGRCVFCLFLLRRRGRGLGIRQAQLGHQGSFLGPLAVKREDFFEDIRR